MSAAPRYVLGLDLGQAQDYTALVIAQPSWDLDPIHDIRHIERMPLGTRYPAVVDHVAAAVATLREWVKQDVTHLDKDWERGLVTYEVRPQLIQPTVTLVVDYTGVGRPVADMLLEAKLDCELILVTITSGAHVTWDDFGVHVPKRDLASVIQRLLQESRLRIAAGLPMSEALKDELANFRVTIGATGHDSYGAGDDWRSGNHDDLVLALALSCWWTEQRARVEIY